MGDITKINEKELSDFDLMTWGFPCQDISVAGKQKGLIKGKTRSGLYYEGLRILQYKKPKYSIIENVKALTGKKFKKEFEQILNDLDEAGYNNYWKVLNAKDFGIPHHRERVFIISIRKDIDNKRFKFPNKQLLSLNLPELLELNIDYKFYLSLKAKARLFNIEIRAEEKGLGYKNVVVDIYYNKYGKLYENKKQLFINLDANFYKGADGKRTMINLIPDNEEANNLLAGIRMPTPLECFRLMGFDDQDYYILKENNISDTQLYKLAGNSIVVNVLEEIFKKLFT